jgi:hypothetical protein
VETLLFAEKTLNIQSILNLYKKFSNTASPTSTPACRQAGSSVRLFICSSVLYLKSPLDKGLFLFWYSKCIMKKVRECGGIKNSFLFLPVAKQVVISFQIQALPFYPMPSSSGCILLSGFF